MTRKRTRNTKNPHVNNQQKLKNNYPYKSQNITVTSASSTQPQSTTSDTPLKETKKKTKNLKIITWNANGLANKRIELKNLIDDEKPDVIAICEAKMDDITVNLMYEFKADGFFPYYKLRDNEGGGVIILVKESITKVPPEKIVLTKDEEEKYKLSNEELVGVRLRIEGKNYHIFCLYVPPEKVLNKNIFEFLAKCGNFVLLGDLNSKLAMYNKKTNANGNRLQNIIDSSNFYVLNEINQPTYIRKHKDKSKASYKSTLDLVIASHDVEKMVKNIQTLPFSAVSKHQEKWFHVPIMVEFTIKVSKNFVRKSKNSSYIYDKANWRSFHQKLDEILIDCDHERMPFRDLSEKIAESIDIAAKSAIPKSKPSSNKRKTNYPIHINNLIAHKRRLNFIFSNNRNKINGENLKAAQIECGEAISAFKQSQWKIFIKNLGPHPLSTITFWRRINRLRNKTQQQNVADLEIDGIKITTNIGKAKVLADRLEGVFSSEVDPKYDSQNFEKINKKINDGIDSMYEANERNTTTFSMQELVKAIKNLNRKTSLDQSQISNRILRQVKQSRIALECLLSLFNKCLNGHEIPEN
jgi:hypothetical protein